MAKIAKNIILHGATGMFGEQIVIRQRDGYTIMPISPEESKTEQSNSKKANQLPVQQAIVYGKNQILDELSKFEYEARGKGLKTSFNVSVADFMLAPDIDEIDVSGYSGSVGDIIRIRCTDNFSVVNVDISIYNDDGTMVEEGQAIQDRNKIDWVYTATVANENTAGDKIVIAATDKYSHATEQQTVS